MNVPPHGSERGIYRKQAGADTSCRNPLQTMLPQGLRLLCAQVPLDQAGFPRDALAAMHWELPPRLKQLDAWHVSP